MIVRYHIWSKYIVELQLGFHGGAQVRSRQGLDPMSQHFFARPGGSLVEPHSHYADDRWRRGRHVQTYPVSCECRRAILPALRPPDGLRLCGNPCRRWVRSARQAGRGSSCFGKSHAVPRAAPRPLWLGGSPLRDCPAKSFTLCYDCGGGEAVAAPCPEMTVATDRVYKVTRTEGGCHHDILE
jgi:hypothetical protein